MPRHLFPALALLAPLGACADFPQLDARISPETAAADYPAIAPLDPILGQADRLFASPRTAPHALDPIQDRIAALNARAARLRQPVIPPRIRAWMLRGAGT